MTSHPNIVLTHHAIERAWYRFRMGPDDLRAAIAEAPSLPIAGAAALAGAGPLQFAVGRMRLVCKLGENDAIVVLTVSPLKYRGRDRKGRKR